LLSHCGVFSHSVSVLTGINELLMFITRHVSWGLSTLTFDSYCEENSECQENDDQERVYDYYTSFCVLDSCRLSHDDCLFRFVNIYWVFLIDELSRFHCEVID